jgi:hypothetical protein
LRLFFFFIISSDGLAKSILLILQFLNHLFNHNLWENIGILVSSSQLLLDSQLSRKQSPKPP